MATVLVVEDEAIIRDMVSEFLEDAGYTVVVATNADHAISILEVRLDIHLVFTDIDMPGSMNGLKLAAAVRDRWPPIHIIITTGKGRPREMPANALFISKPYLGQNVVTAMKTFENMSS
jgi:two-component system, response regulator PdtaR